MTEPQTLSAYFTYCKLQKNLDNKTLKAYQIDLKQFVDFYPKPTTVTRTDMELYIEHLMERYKASTVKRKIAALKAYYHYLVYEEILEHSPFEKIQLHIRQEILLPRTIDRPILGAIFSAAYRELSTAHSKAARRETIRNIAVLELLFASGIRVSELCTITCDNLNLDSQVVLIRGKGSKERKIYLASAPVIRALKKYLQVRVPRVADEPFFFLNRDGNLSLIHISERTATVGRKCAVAVHHELAPGQTGIGIRTALHKLAAGVQDDFRIIGGHTVKGQREHIFVQQIRQLIDVGVLLVLDRNDHRGDAHRGITVVFHRDLHLAVRADVGDNAGHAGDFQQRYVKALRVRADELVRRARALCEPQVAAQVVAGAELRCV